MSSNTCPVCGKKVYRTWRHAASDAQQVRDRRNHERMAPYYSRPCQSIHVGKAAPKRPRRPSHRHATGS